MEIITERFANIKNFDDEKNIANNDDSNKTENLKKKIKNKTLKTHTIQIIIKIDPSFQFFIVSVYCITYDLKKLLTTTTTTTTEHALKNKNKNSQNCLVSFDVNYNTIASNFNNSNNNNINIIDNIDSSNDISSVYTLAWNIFKSIRDLILPAKTFLLTFCPSSTSTPTSTSTIINNSSNVSKFINNNVNNSNSNNNRINKNSIIGCSWLHQVEVEEICLNPFLCQNFDNHYNIDNNYKFVNNANSDFVNNNVNVNREERVEMPCREVIEKLQFQSLKSASRSQAIAFLYGTNGLNEPFDEI
jgi:hypothetical protein